MPHCQVGDAGPWIIRPGVPHRFSGDQRDNLPPGGEGTVCVPMIAGLTEQQARKDPGPKKNSPNWAFPLGRCLDVSDVSGIFGGDAFASRSGIPGYLILFHAHFLMSFGVMFPCQVQGLREVFSLFDPEGRVTQLI